MKNEKKEAKKKKEDLSFFLFSLEREKQTNRQTKNRTKKTKKR